jgi:hypothetical protein
VNIRMVETRPGDVIATMNANALLKFIGWCEAHRPSADYEPSFLGRCLIDLELADEGYPLDAAVECGACGETYSLQSADAHLYRDGEWYCKNRDECDERSSVICAGCGAKYHPSSSDVFHDPDANGWFCSNSEKCNQRRMGGAA